MTGGDVPSQGGDGSLVPAQVEAELQPVIKDLPPPKQEEIVRTVERTMIAMFRGGSGFPSVDPETAKVLTASIDRDNENKFKYLTQKQTDTAAERARDQTLEATRHKDLVKPVVWAVILITVVAVLAGVYFISNDKEAVGSSILTGVFGAILGFLGGLGTAKIKS